MSGFQDLFSDPKPLQLSPESGREPHFDTSITPVQQMISSCTGALVTSIFGIDLIDS